MVGKFSRIKKVKKDRTVKTLLVFLVECRGPEASLGLTQLRRKGSKDRDTFVHSFNLCEILSLPS